MAERLIRKVLVANRGEIACRIIRTLQTLGIRSVAIYSDVDRNALHVTLSDEAQWVGYAPASESYLNIGRVIDIAIKTKVDAIHPGYGFLSENPAFARACEESGIRFIGPSAKVIELMGRKDLAKQVMHKVGVPIVLGYHGDRQDADFLSRQAKNIGYPVLIKALAGGGGKGMRQVVSPDEFIEALASARREAQSSFADDRVLIEKVIPSPRHIEFQIFADNHGNVIHMFERDCSLQRRFQKVIEESPAPGMTQIMRRAMGEAAVNAARAVSYSGAGTVEFIVDGSDGLQPDRFWFMEMNTRLQVEHPVTEAVVRQDLVAWQIAVAEGRPLPLTQDELEIQGHAIEARLYAEDPERSFLPATGTLHRLDLDTSARVDTGVRQGDQITPWYDPMIAKIIVHAPNRPAALNQLSAALENSFVAGCPTNLRFLARLCRLPQIVQGYVGTELIADQAAKLSAAKPPPPAMLAAAAVVICCPQSLRNLTDPWDHYEYWRSWGEVELSVSLNGIEVRLILSSDGLVSVFVGDWEGQCAWDPSGTGRLLINGVMVPLRYYRDGQYILIAVQDQEWHLVVDDPGTSAEEGGDAEDRVVAPMPGLVTRIVAKAGDVVVEKQLLVVLEAMKMEHALHAPCNGVIAKVHVHQGDQVESDALLIELATNDAEFP